MRYSKSLYITTLQDNHIVALLAENNKDVAPTSPHAMKLAIRKNFRTLRIKEMTDKKDEIIRLEKEVENFMELYDKNHGDIEGSYTEKGLHKLLKEY